MPHTAMAANVARLPRRGNARGCREAFAFKPELVLLDAAAADHPQAIRILNSLQDVDVDLIEDVAHLRRPADLDEARRRLILTTRDTGTIRSCRWLGGELVCCGFRRIDPVVGSPIAASFGAEALELSRAPAITAYVNLETALAQVSAYLRRNSGRFFRMGVGELSDALALDPILDFGRVLIPFFASRRNAILELKTRTDGIDHLLGLKHRNRTVISWPLNTAAVIASEERGSATLDGRFEAARKAAAAGYGVGFHLDPIIVRTTAEEAVEEYLPIIDRLLQEVEPRQLAWVSLGLLRSPLSLPERAMADFPQTRIFTGELVPVGGALRYPRFLRERVLKPLWERLATKLPPHKVFLCGEGKEIWSRLDPSVESGACLEKRLCNTEILHGGF